jgi:hypothetical protein
MVVNSEVERLKRFQNFLAGEDKVVFEDLLNQCKLYASYAGNMAMTLSEVPMIISMLFSHHKKLWQLEKRLIKNGVLPASEDGQKPKTSQSNSSNVFDAAAVPLQDTAG